MLTMVQDPYGVLADDRINDNLDWRDIRNREDYRKKVKEFLESTPDRYGHMRGTNLLKDSSTIDKMYEESSAIEKVENKKKEELESLRKAQILESKRNKVSREADERKTHKITREVNQRNVSRWRHKMGRLDLRGIDTKRRMRMNNSNLITRRDLRLKNISVVMCSNQIKRYRNPSTGRWIPDPFKIKTPISK
jgi:hypothetical protein